MEKLTNIENNQGNIIEHAEVIVAVLKIELEDFKSVFKDNIVHKGAYPIITRIPHIS